MPRIRSLHPGQATDEDFVEMSRDARLFALHLRCEADDQGVFEWKPKRLKMAIFPADDDVDVSALLSELVENRQVVEFEVEGKRFGAIRNFRLWQRPKKPNATHPLPSHLQQYVGMKGGELPTGSEPGDDEGGAVPNQIPTSSENLPQMEDEGGRREEAKASKTRERAQTDADFGEFWSVFPRRTGKGQAEKAYRTARQLASAEDIADGARRYAVERAGQDPKYTRIPSTWLNGKGWLDEVPANVVPIGRPRDLREIRDPVERARFQSF